MFNFFLLYFIILLAINMYNNKMQLVKPGYNNINIGPPQSNEKKEYMKRQLIIDSSYRNINNYPNVNNYTIDIEDEFKNITSLQLTQVNIPKCAKPYTINDSNNKLYFQEQEDSIICVTLDEGDYSIDDLLKNIGVKMTEKSTLLRTYTLTIPSVPVGNPSTQKVEISFVPTFTLIDNYFFNLVFDLSKFNIQNNSCLSENGNKASTPEQNLRKILGFDFGNFGLEKVIQINGDKITLENSDLSFLQEGVNVKLFSLTDKVSPANVTIKSISKNVITLDIEITGDLLTAKNVYLTSQKLVSHNKTCIDDLNLIVMHIEDFEQFDSQSKPSKDAFAIIPVRGEINTIDSNNENIIGNIKYFNPPLPRLQKLRLKFLDRYGNPYNFQGRDHLLHFEMGLLNQRKIYP